MKILALGFRRGCGKDTLAKMVQRELRIKNKNLKVHVCGFADQLKTICYSLYGWLGVKTPQFYEDYPEAKDEPMMGLPNGYKTVRDLWIAFGNHCRELDNGIWRNALLKTQSSDVLIIKDLRFVHECEDVLKHHGQVCRLDRPGTDGHDGEPDTVLMNYEGWTNVYRNDGDLHDLYKVAVQIAEGLL